MLSAIFNYATARGHVRAAANPVSAPTSAASRRPPHSTSTSPTRSRRSPASLPTAFTAAHRRRRWRRELALRCAEDAQDAELFRVLAYTGLRIGEAIALRWGDVDLGAAG